MYILTAPGLMIGTHRVAGAFKSVAGAMEAAEADRAEVLGPAEATMVGRAARLRMEWREVTAPAGARLLWPVSEAYVAGRRAGYTLTDIPVGQLVRTDILR